MPPHGKEKEKKNLSLKEHEKLIKKYNIRFDGPLPKSEWPRRYSGIYLNFEQVKGKRFNDEASDKDRQGWLRLQERALELNRFAKDCRCEGANEIKWRTDTETIVLKRFTEEFAWLV